MDLLIEHLDFQDIFLLLRDVRPGQGKFNNEYSEICADVLMA